MKKIINLLLATIVILSSCSKEDDLLTPVPNSPTNITNTDTTVITNGNNGTTTLEHTPNENLVVDNEFVNYTTADLEGSKWRVTYNSFYLNNRFPICPMPYDTIVGPNVWTNLGGEMYFSNQGDGYFKTRTYLLDCAPLYLQDGTAHYEPVFNYVPNPNNPDPLFKQDYVDYTVRDGEIITNVVAPGGWQYTITLTIVEQTNTTLILENNSHYDNPNTNAQGYPTYYDRNIRLELEKIN